MNKKKYILPDFLCIGTYRAGTTWLYKALKDYEEIYLPDEKELMYFSNYFERGIGWYSAFFKKAKANQLVGEICPTYLSSKESPKRIKEYIPEAKLIAILRDPKEQIISMYKLMLARGYIDKSIDDVIKNEKYLIDNVCYYTNLKRYLKYFEREKILILLFEELKNDANKFLHKITEFLEIEFKIPKRTKNEVNKSGRAKIKFVDKYIASVGDMMRKKNMYKIKNILNKIGIVDTIKRLNRKDDYDVTISLELSEYIDQKICREIILLEDMLKVDLSSWRGN